MTKIQRLSREEWLDRALEVLAKEGGKLRIDRLVAALGVTKGSFYWHFRDRTDFVKSVAEYWANKFTTIVPDAVAEVEGNAEQRLLATMQIIVEKNLTRYDLPIRAWAVYEPEVARIVKRVDEFRLGFVRSLFSEMGFRGDELEMRTRTFVTFYSAELSIYVRETRRQRMRLLKLRHEFFVRRV